MADQSPHNTTAEEFDKMLKDPGWHRFFDLPSETSETGVNESPLSTMTTPDPLNTAFINETNIHGEHSQSSSSQQQQQQQSQTTYEASSAMHGLISAIIEQEEEQHERINLNSPKKIMISTGTMPKTPTMKSTGTMPKTPTPAPMASFSASANDVIILSSSTPPSTIDLISPTIEVVDLCSPEETPDNVHSSNPTPYLPPQ